MAFIRDYELPGSGATIPNAYHVVTGVKVNKRVKDVPGPVDMSRPDGLTAGSQDPDKAVYWKAGYIGQITVTIWGSKQGRIDDMKPIGFMGVEPSETEFEGNIGTPDMDGKCIMFMDMDSSDSYVTQAYNHLRSLPYYASATIDDDPVSEDDDEFVEGSNTDATDSANT